MGLVVAFCGMKTGLLQFGCLVVSVICFASFTWSVGYLFRRPKSVSGQMKHLSFWGLLFFIAQVLAIAKQTHIWIVTSTLALLMYVGALALFYSSVPFARKHGFGLAFSNATPDQVVRTGPYRHIRHPFYASYLLFWIAGVLASRQPFLLVSVVVMSRFYARAIAQEEQELLNGPLSTEYADYKAFTGSLFPKIRDKSKRSAASQRLGI
jgi:protein-S-isoprenylcysteine O-methyltransferase Ste14